MKQTIVYEKEYKQVIKTAYSSPDRFDPEPHPRFSTFENNEKDNIQNDLNRLCIVLSYEKTEEMGPGIILYDSKPTKFLYQNTSLFYIELNKENLKNGNYKRIIKIQSMPPSEIPKTLEKLLIKKGFKKGEFKEKIPWWKQPEKKLKKVLKKYEN